MATLNLGVGWCADPNALNVDRVLLPGVDLVWDVDEHPWPFDDQAFDEVRAVQLFEHVVDPIGFMKESHRVLKPGGLLLLVVPHWQSENSHTDPTHLRHCTERSFDYWCEGEQLHDQLGYAYAGNATFTKERVEVGGGGADIFVRLRRAR